MKRPRGTTWWLRQQQRHSELWQLLLNDPDARVLVAQIATLFGAAYALKPDDHDLDTLLEAAWLGCVRLADSTAWLAPDLIGFYGDQLPEAVWRFVAGHELAALGLDVASALKGLPPLYVRALPNTGITFAGGNAIVPLGFARVDLLLLADFQDTYRVTRSKTGKPGRPTGSTSTNAEARRAFALDEQGKSWQEIAEALWGRRPDVDVDVNYEAVRKRVRRRVNWGRGLAATN